MYRKMVVVCVLLSWAFTSTLAPPASAVNSPQGVVVSDNPVDDTPHVLDGRVYAVAKVGSKVVLGGTFTVARDHNNSNQQSRFRILSFDATTRRIDQTFVPQLNGAVNSLAADPSGTAVYVGGSFTTVNGVANRGLAKINLADGQLVAGWKAPTTAAVNSVVVNNGKLYVGGVFGKVKGVVRPGLAAVSLTNGAVDANLNIPVTTPMFKGTAGVKELDVSPDGSKLVLIGNFASVGGQARTQMAMINLGAPATVSSWQTSKYGNNCSSVFDTYMRDVDISPDGSYAAVVTTGGPGNDTNGLCDSTARWDLDRTGPAQLPTWTDWTGGDTLLSVAVTDVAVYVGGHQRWLNNAGGRDRLRPSGVSRDGIGAHDPLNGRPLSWNPSRTRGYGATALEAYPEGLYVGSDTTELGHEFHGRIGMFPTAGGTAPVVATPSTSPTSLYLAETDGDLMRTAFDGTPSGTATQVSGTPVDNIDWNAINGAFSVNGVVYTLANGKLNTRTYDGTTFGSSTQVPTWYTFSSSTTALAFVDGYLYYTRSSDPRLYRRGMTLDGYLIDPLEYTVSGSGDGLDWRNVIGMTVVDGKLLAAYSNGNLTSTDLALGVPVAATRTTISGPLTDGRNWNGRDLFAFSPAGTPATK
jgi:hypothetical protein